MKLSPLHTFGINGCIRDNLVVYSDPNGNEQVVFPVGSSLVAYNKETRSTSFFEAQKHLLTKNAPPTSLTMAPNEKYIAVAYSATDGDGGLVVVYKTGTRKKVASMLNRSRVTSMCFSHDTKHIICACEDSISLWLWENDKLDFSAAITGTITRVSCSLSQFSSSSSLFVTSGRGHNRLWFASSRSRYNLTNTKLTQTETNETKYQYEDNTWLSVGDKEQDMLLAIIAVPLKSDDNGMLSVTCHDDSVVNIYRIADGISSSRPRVEHDQTIVLGLQKDMCATTIAALRSSPGFAIGATAGTIILYEYQEVAGNQKKHVQTKKVSNGSDSPVVSIFDRKMYDDSLLVYCNNSIDTLNISEFEVANSSLQPFLIDAGHKGGIVDLDCCLEKPYIVTCGLDQTVKVWNSQLRRCMITHKNDEPHTVAIHPSGHQLAVGYNDKLVLYHILVNELIAYREMTCKSPVRNLVFSEGGQYLAAANSNVISVFSTYQDKHPTTFLVESSFIGHTGSIQCLQWAGEILYSTGTDRNIFGWDMQTGVRIDNLNCLRLSGVCMSIAVATSQTLLNTAVCTSDGALHKIEWSGRSTDESTVTLLCSPSYENKITTVCLSPDKSTLFAATQNGIVRIYNWLSDDDPTQILQQVAHHCTYSLVTSQISPTVSRMVCSGAFLISTGGEDGSILFSDYLSSQAHQNLLLSPSLINDDIVLISIYAYEETKELINDLKGNINALKSDHEFELHSQEALMKKELDKHKTNTEKHMEVERVRRESIEANLEKTISSHANEIISRDGNDKNKLQELEDFHEQRLSDERSRYARLRNTQESLDDLLAKQKAEFQNNLKRSEQNSDSERKKLRTQFHQLEKEATESDKIFREILDQQEEEYEMELIKLKASSDEQLRIQRTRTQEIQNHMQGLNREKNLLFRQKEELRSKASFAEDAVQSKYEMRKKQETVISNFETQINDIEGKVSTGERELKQMSSENQSLSLQNIAHETRINALECEKAPLLKKIEEMSRDMNTLSYQMKEKENLVVTKELEIENLNEKMTSQSRLMKHLEAQVRTLKREFVLLGGLENIEEIKNAVTAAYTKYAGLSQHVDKKVPNFR